MAYRSSQLKNKIKSYFNIYVYKAVEVKIKHFYILIIKLYY